MQGRKAGGNSPVEKSRQGERETSKGISSKVETITDISRKACAEG